jgi:hypothetical protein
MHREQFLAPQPGLLMDRRTLGLEAGTGVGLILRRDVGVTDDLHMPNNYHKTFDSCMCGDARAHRLADR